MINKSYLQHQLTAEEASFFEREGYLIFPNALTEKQVAQLLNAVEKCRHYLKERDGVQQQDRFLLLDCIGLEEAFLDLIDLPTIFPKIWGILGWNIQIYNSNLSVAPPMGESGAVHRVHYLHSYNPSLNTMVAVQSPQEIWKWHRDGGRLNVELGELPHPRISVKVAFFLTDTLEENCGNMYIVPGSHKDLVLWSSHLSTESSPSSSVPVQVKAGSAMIFDRRLLHSASPNVSTHIRKVLFYGYSYRWLRPRDDMTVAHYFDQVDPIRRQLLGYSLSAYGYSSPCLDDVPLRQWLEQHKCLPETS